MKQGGMWKKRVLALVLSAAMVVMPADISMAAESEAPVSAQNTVEEGQTEVQEQEGSGTEDYTGEVTAATAEEDRTESAETEKSTYVESTEAVEEEKSFGGESEESSMAEETAGEGITEAFSVNEEDSAETVSIEETMSVSEIEAEEEISKLEFSEDDIAHGEYIEGVNNIIWVIDANGNLTVEGTGDFSTKQDWDRAPWYEKCGEILSAKINVKNMTNASYMFYGCEDLVNVDLGNFDT